MQAPDLVNGLFECVGGWGAWMNCLRLYRDKQVKGVVWYLTIFWFLWGAWNLYYYPHLDQWLSFLGGCVIVTGNLAWLGMLWYVVRVRRMEQQKASVVEREE
jgi:hypothetical protein